MAVHVGDIVMYTGLNSNGINTHPALVTRVWQDATVNLIVFPDGTVIPQAQNRLNIRPAIQVSQQDIDAGADYYEERV